MKRRDFVSKASAGVAALITPGLTLGQIRPCAPPTLGVAGGSSVTTTCAAGAVADWESRSTAPGVVWAHNFETATEVSVFRDEAAGQNNIHLGAGLGPNVASPNCLEISIPQGLYPGDTYVPADAVSGHLNGVYQTASSLAAIGRGVNGAWIRPMSAVMLNGRSVPDPADGGTLPRRSMAVGQWDAGWSKGYYGHLTAQATYSTWRGDANAWDGNEFWLQYWTKFPSNRWNLGLPHGKHVMMLAYPADRYSQELVVQSLGNTAGGNWPESVSAPRRRFEMYTGYGSWWGTLSDPQGNVGGQAAIQPGYNAPTCYYSPSSTPNYAGCWEYPAEEWVNLLIHVKPSPNIPGGINSYPSIVAMPSQYRTFQIEVWGVRQSQLASGYTKIYSKADYAWSYGDESNPNGIASYAGQQFHPPAFNSFLFNAYMNGRPSTEAFYHRYAQIIFSRRPISPPQA